MSASKILRKRALKRTRSVQFPPTSHPDFKKTYYFQPMNICKTIKEAVQADEELTNSRKKTTLLKSHSFAYGELNRVFYATSGAKGGQNGQFPNGRILLKRKTHPVRFPSQERIDGFSHDEDFRKTAKQWQRAKPSVMAEMQVEKSDAKSPNIQEKDTHKDLTEKTEAISNNGLDSSSSDSGFDSSSPATDRRETSAESKLAGATRRHKALTRTDPKNVSFSLQTTTFTNSLSELSDLPSNSDSKDTQCVTNQPVSDAAEKPERKAAQSSEDDNEVEKQKLNSQSTHECDAAATPKPNFIKSILKPVKTSTENNQRHGSVTRSKTFASAQIDRPGSSGSRSKSMLKKNGNLLYKSISFTTLNNKALSSPQRHSCSGHRTRSLYDLPRCQEGPVIFAVFEPVKQFGEYYGEQKQRNQKLSSQSFGGKVQNYPYNTRWTWKPVARSRTVRTFQPKSIIVRHSPVGRHSSQRLVMYQSIGKNEAYLRLLANQLLTKEESEVFKDALHNFRVSKSIPKLCSQLRPIISTVEKMILLVEISNRLPSHLRQDFHRLCSLHFDKYNDVLNTMAPGKQFQEKAKIIAQDSTGGIRVLAKGNQKTLVFTSQADQEALRRNAASASESSLTIDQPLSDKSSSLFQSDESLRMFRKSLSSENSEDTLFAARNQLNTNFNNSRTQNESKMAIYSQPMQLGSSLDSSTASESFETFRNKYDNSNKMQTQVMGQLNRVPINHMTGVQFRPAVRHVSLSRSGCDSLGISIRGGKEHATPVIVQSVEPGSQSEKQGLTSGDIILEVNGYNFQNIPHYRAVEIIKSQHNLHMTVTKARPQPVPDNMPKGLGDPIPVHRLVEKDVTLTATKEGGLGFSLSGGADQTASPIVADVFKNSPAEKAGLMKEDRVLKILGIDIRELTHKQIVALATSSKVLKLRIQRRIQEEARNVHHGGTIYSGNYGVPASTNGILSPPNGDGPQFASSPVIRRKSQSSMSIDGDDKENNRLTSGPPSAQAKSRNFFNISNGNNGNHLHDAHNLKVHAAQVSSYNVEDSDFQMSANGRRKYVKRKEQGSPTVHKDSVYSTYSYRQGAPPIDQNGFFGGVGSTTTTMERRSHHSSASEINKSPHATLQKNKRPFSSFIVVPTPKVTSKDVNMKAALKEGLEKRNKALQNLRNVQPSAKDEEWKI